MLFPSEDASLSTVEFMVHQRVLESMPITGVDQQGALVKSDPLANDKQQPHHSHGRVGSIYNTRPEHGTSVCVVSLLYFCLLSSKVVLLCMLYAGHSNNDMHKRANANTKRLMIRY